MDKYVWILFCNDEVQGVYLTEGNANYIQHEIWKFDSEIWCRIEKHEIQSLNNSL